MARQEYTSNSTIGEGSTFEGDFYISGSLRIDGFFEGNIHAEDTLIIGETGRVKTNIRSREVIVAGALIGNINATEQVTLGETCRMIGDVSASYLHISKGTTVQGKINITGGNTKGVLDLVKKAFEATSKTE